MRTDKLTVKSQEAMNEALKLAETNGNPAVDAIHLLAALLQQREGLVLPTLEKTGVNTAALRREVEAEVDREPKQTGGTGTPTTTSALKKIFELSEKESLRLKDDFISTEHLLLALTQINS